jgi:hypothetical protein
MSNLPVVNKSLFATAGLPAVTSITTALRSIQTGSGSGAVLLKMDKTGHWVFGADQTDVQDGTAWAVNPFSFVHGYIAWGDGVVLGERMESVPAPKPDLGPAPTGWLKGWEDQIGMSLRCVSGEDDGMEVRFSTTSVGGKRAVQELAAALATQVETNQETPVPKITLTSEHYQHKSYGRIYTPVFTVVDWWPLSGDPKPQGALALGDTTPTRRRKSA